MPRRYRLARRLTLGAVLVSALALAAAPAATAADEILFVRGLDVFAVDADTGAERAITSDGTSNSPRWSPDRTQIAYASSRVATQEIWLAAADGSGARRVTFSSPGQALMPAFAPDGLRIAYARSPKGLFGDQRPPRRQVTGLWTAALDRSGQAALTTGPSDNMPSWSVDGRVAFLRQGRRASEIWVVRPAAGKPRRLVPAPAAPAWGGDAEPDWSPDGRLLVFSRAVVGPGKGELRRSVYVVRADGRGARRLTRGLDASWPRFSPDGSRIAFVGNGQVWVMDADGSDRRRLTGDPAGADAIDW